MRCRLLVLLTLLLASCAAVDTSFRPAETRVQPPPKPPGCSIMVLRAPPQRSYVEIGTASVSGGTWYSQDEAERRLSEKACEVGGDAILVASERYTDGPESLQVGRRSGATAAVLVFTDGASATASPTRAE